MKLFLKVNSKPAIYVLMINMVTQITPKRFYQQFKNYFKGKPFFTEPIRVRIYQTPIII